MSEQKQQKDPETGLPNEGEGSRSAARAYDEKVTRAARDAQHMKEAAEKAAKALEGDEAEELRGAEEKAKRGEHRP
ncbi:MAG TPA: hypothetical protein VF765_22110 [Polyangiaceae bacterium]